MDVTWRRLTQFPLHILSFGEDAVVYHSGSGNTHQLDELSLVILEALTDEPCDLASLSARVASLTGLDDGPDLRIAIELRLSELAKHAMVKHYSRQ